MSDIQELLQRAAEPTGELDLERVQREGRRHRQRPFKVAGAAVAVVAITALVTVAVVDDEQRSAPVIAPHPAEVAAGRPPELVVVTGDGQVQVRSSLDGRLIRTLAERAVARDGSGLSVTPDGATLYFTASMPLFGGAANMASVPVAGGDVTRVWGGGCCGEDPAVSPDGRWLASSGVPNASDAGQDILLLDLQAHGSDNVIYDRRWHATTVPGSPRAVSQLTWAPDSRHIAFRLGPASGGNGAMHVLDIEEPESTPLDTLATVAFDARTYGYLGDTGQMLGVSDADDVQRVVALDPKTGAVVRTLFELSSVRDPVSDPTGRHVLALAGDLTEGRVFRWSQGDAEPTRLDLGTGVVAAIWLPDASKTATTSTTTTTTPSPARADAWVPTARSPIADRPGGSAVWTGTEMIVLGGANNVPTRIREEAIGFHPNEDGSYTLWKTVRFRDVAAYDPARDTWRSLAPLPEYDAGGLGLLHTAWTGSEVVVVTSDALFVYTPTADAWRQIALPKPIGYGGAIAWTGDELLLWGYPYHQPAAPPWTLAFSPSTGVWRSFDPGPLGFTEVPAFAWTGSEMIVAGGRGTSRPNAAAYNPATDTWRLIAPIPMGITHTPQAVWTGREMIVVETSYGAWFAMSYDPGADAWHEITAPPEIARHDQLVVWTGAEVLVIDGTVEEVGSAQRREGGPVGHASAYDPTTEAWRILPAIQGPETCGSAGVWTGSTVIVWGGNELCNSALTRPRAETWVYTP